MKRFLASQDSTAPKKVAASGSAAQPAYLSPDEHDIQSVSAAQPALQLRSIRDAQRWLATECVSEDAAAVQRLREALGILARPKPRQEDIRQLQVL